MRWLVISFIVIVSIAPKNEKTRRGWAGAGLEGQQVLASLPAGARTPAQAHGATTTAAGTQGGHHSRQAEQVAAKNQAPHRAFSRGASSQRETRITCLEFGVVSPRS